MNTPTTHRPRCSKRCWRDSRRPAPGSLARGKRRAAGRRLAPRPRDVGVHLGHLPDEVRQARLRYLEAQSDFDAGTVAPPSVRLTPFAPVGAVRVRTMLAHPADGRFA